MRIRRGLSAARRRSADELALERLGLRLVGGVPASQRSLDDLGGEEDAVQMVDLVLDRPSQEAVALDADLLAVAVLPLGDDALTAGDLVESKPRFTEALRIAREIEDAVRQSLGFIEEQIASATASSGPGDLEKALLSGEIWTVE